MKLKEVLAVSCSLVKTCEPHGGQGEKIESIHTTCFNSAPPRLGVLKNYYYNTKSN